MTVNMNSTGISDLAQIISGDGSKAVNSHAIFNSNF